jgi:hypothetical protein
MSGLLKWLASVIADWCLVIGLAIAVVVLRHCYDCWREGRELVESRMANQFGQHPEE